MGVGTGVAMQNGKETPGMLYVSPLWALFAPSLKCFGSIIVSFEEYFIGPWGMHLSTRNGASPTLLSCYRIRALRKAWSTNLK